MENKLKECCNMCSRSFPPHCDTCPCHTSPKEEYIIKYCTKCIQMTNHIGRVCQKCLTVDNKEVYSSEEVSKCCGAGSYTKYDSFIDEEITYCSKCKFPFDTSPKVSEWEERFYIRLGELVLNQGKKDILKDDYFKAGKLANQDVISSTEKRVANEIILEIFKMKPLDGVSIGDNSIVKVGIINLIQSKYEN